MPASGRKQGRVELQSRDHELLVGLFESRLMTLDQAARLYFAGRPEAAKKRIQQLKAAGYIGARPRRPTEPSILYITRLGFQAVSDRGLPPHYPPLGWEALERRRAVSDSTLRHELAVMEVKAVLCATIAASPRLRVVEFSTWPVLFEFIARRRDPLAGALRDIPVRPDGFIRVHEEERDGGVSEHIFFLELDRSNEAQRSRFVPKAGSYADYYRRGGLAERFGATRDEYDAYPFRVLFVVPTAERRNNTLVGLLIDEPLIRNQVWLATFDAVRREPLGAIWITPADYERATAGTPYAPDREPRPYKTRPDRQAFVEEHVRPRALFDE